MVETRIPWALVAALAIFGPVASADGPQPANQTTTYCGSNSWVPLVPFHVVDCGRATADQFSLSTGFTGAGSDVRWAQWGFRLKAEAYSWVLGGQATFVARDFLANAGLVDNGCSGSRVDPLGLSWGAVGSDEEVRECFMLRFLDPGRCGSAVAGIRGVLPSGPGHGAFSVEISEQGTTICN